MNRSSETPPSPSLGEASRPGSLDLGSFDESAAEKRQQRRKRMRQLAFVALGLGLAALLVLALQPRPIPVDLAAVERGALQVTLDEEGETRVRDRYVVSAPFAGRVLRIELEPGDPVRAGDTVLATFEPADPNLLDARSEAQAVARVRSAEANLGRARAEAQRAEADLKFARTDLERIERLRQEQVVAVERLDQAELAAERAEEARRAARFEIETAEHELEVAEAGLLQVTGQGSDEAVALTSPIDGVVLRRLRESESVVPAGEALLEVADPARLEIVSDYLSKDAVAIRAGSPVLIEQWGGERPLLGRVRRVEPSGFTKISALGVEEQRVNVIVDFEDPRAAWEALGDGYRVEVRVVVYECSDCLRVPTSALFRQSKAQGAAGSSDRAWAVFAEEDGVARLRPVRVGERNGELAEVLEGLD
ncbi:MAG: HlyD family efflux transporter periplasmic adaptor subunit, partial [Holophagales bacterium]|nr:HlyD family efflux transporter periplasmic adaptor subunit [Holophagales bacterium]